MTKARVDRCPTCGVEFRAPEKFGPQGFGSGKTCPNGHYHNMGDIRRERAAFPRAPKSGETVAPSTAVQPAVMTERELPPLPFNLIGLKHMLWPLSSLYTADQMRAYAQAAIASRQGERELMERDAARLRDAIKWALGAHETDGFRERAVNEGPHWWRRELAARAWFAWDGEKYAALSPEATKEQP